jgi:hypothetical protein
MTTVYPNAYDTTITLGTATGGSNDYLVINNAVGAIIAIETELGLVPAGPYASVRTRLDILEARIGTATGGGVPNPFFIGNTSVSIGTGTGAPVLGSAASGSLYLRQDGTAGEVIYYVDNSGNWDVVGATTVGGDLSGTTTNATVIGIQTIPVSSTSPTTNQVLEYNGSEWAPTTLSPGFTAGGDLSGTNTDQKVIGIQGNPVSDVAPIAAQILVENSGATGSVWTTISGDIVMTSAGVVTVGKIQGNTVTSGALVKGDLFIATTTSNWAATAVTGDVSFSAATPGLTTVLAINGTSVPATPTANQVLVATSGTTATWELITNSQVSNSAAVAVSKLASGTSAQILLNNSTPTPTWTTVTGDVVISNTGTTTVDSIQGVAISGIPQDGYVLEATSSTAASWQAPGSTILLSGDVTGAADANTVVNITGSGGFIPFNATIIGEQSASFPVSFGVNIVTIPSDANYVLTAAQIINPFLRVSSGVPLTATRTVTLPATMGAIYYVYNNTTGGQSLTFQASTGTGVTIPNGLKSVIYFDGTNYVVTNLLIGGDLSATSNIAQSVVSVTGAGGILPVAATAADIQWTAGTVSPQLSQANNTSSSAIGQTLTIQSQNATGTTSTGGNLFLSSGTGTNTDGYVAIQVGGSSVGIFNATSITLGDGSITSINISDFSGNGTVDSSGVNLNPSTAIAGTVTGTSPQSEPGTATVTNGSPSVSGAGTNWVGLTTNSPIQFSGSSLSGTLSFTNGSASVSGSGTSFLTQIAVGQGFTVSGGSPTAAGSYVVASITNNTSLTLVTPYLGANTSGVTATPIYIISTVSASAITLTSNYLGTSSSSATLTPLNTIIIGSGTSFLTQLKAGQVIRFTKGTSTTDGQPYSIASIQSNTQLTLDQNYYNTSTSGQAIVICPQFTAPQQTTDTEAPAVVLHGSDAWIGATTHIKGGNITLIPGAPTVATANGGSVLVTLNPINNEATPNPGTYNGQDGCFSIINGLNFNPNISAANFSVAPYGQSCRVYIGSGGTSYIDQSNNFTFNAGGSAIFSTGGGTTIFTYSNSIGPATSNNSNLHPQCPVTWTNGTTATLAVTQATSGGGNQGASNPITLVGQNAFPGATFAFATSVTVSASATVTTAGNFQTTVVSGQSVIFSTQPGVYYTVQTVSSGTSLTLTTSYSGATTGTATMYLVPVNISGSVGGSQGGVSYVQGGAGGADGYVGLRGGVRIGVGADSTETMLEVAETTINTISGNVTNTSGSTTVTGSGTSFLTQLNVGQNIIFSNQIATSYTIATISSNTSLTLTANFTGNFTGTVAATNGSPIITGTGTSFQSQLIPGQTFLISGVSYTIGYVASATSLTLTTNYAGSTASGLTISVTGASGVTVTVGQRAVALCQLGSGVTTTQLPAYSGDGVAYLANAQYVPTVAPTGGVTLYSSNGFFSERDQSGSGAFSSPSVNLNPNTAISGTISTTGPQTISQTVNINTNTTGPFTTSATTVGTLVIGSAVQFSTASQVSGTVALTNGSTTVTGTGTSFTTQLAAGMAIAFSGGSTVVGTGYYVIASIASNTSLTLNTVYIGATTTGNATGNTVTPIYIISAVTSTQITLTTSYLGPTNASASMTPLNTVVTGSGTSFLTQLQAGQVIRFTSGVSTTNGLAYSIASIQSNTQLTLDQLWYGTSLAGQTVLLCPELTTPQQTSDTEAPSVAIHGSDAWVSSTTHVNGGNIMLIPGAPATNTAKGGSVMVLLNPVSNAGLPGGGSYSGQDAAFSVISGTNFNPGVAVANFSVEPYGGSTRVSLGGNGNYFDSTSSNLTINPAGTGILSAAATTIMTWHTSGAINSTLNIQPTVPIVWSNGVTATLSIAAPNVGGNTGLVTPLIVKGQDETQAATYVVNGTVSIASGTPTIVTGASTSFTNQIIAGQTIEFSTQIGTYYIIASIPSSTQLTLTTSYSGSLPISGASLMVLQTNDAVANGGVVYIEGGAAAENGWVGLRGPVRLAVGGDTAETLVEVVETDIITISGTVTNTVSNVTVTGSSTSFLTQLNIGQTIQFSNQIGVNYTIAAIASNTSLTLAAGYTGTLTGTVAAINGSPTITGTSTLFTTQILPGQTIAIGGVNYVVGFITSATSLTLTTNYSGSTASGLSLSSPGASGVTINVGQRAVSLGQLGSGVSTAQLPAYSGDGVVYISNAQYAPIASPTNGLTLYSVPDYIYTLSGTFDTINGSPTVSTTSSQVGVLLPGYTIVFGNQPAVVYYVSIVSSTTVTLGSHFSGTSNTTNTAVTSVGTLGLYSPGVQFNSAQTSPTINQGAVSTASTNGQTLTVQAQNAAGTTSNGGNLALTSGTGTTQPGQLQLQAGGVTTMFCDGYSLGLDGYSAALGGTQTITLTQTQATNAVIVLTGTATGSTTVVFPTPTTGALHVWWLDCSNTSGISGTNTVVPKINGNAVSTAISNAGIYELYYSLSSGKFWYTSISNN